MRIEAPKENPFSLDIFFGVGRTDVHMLHRRTHGRMDGGEGGGGVNMSPVNISPVICQCRQCSGALQHSVCGCVSEGWGDVQTDKKL